MNCMSANVPFLIFNSFGGVIVTVSACLFYSSFAMKSFSLMQMPPPVAELG